MSFSLIKDDLGRSAPPPLGQIGLIFSLIQGFNTRGKKIGKIYKSWFREVGLLGQGMCLRPRWTTTPHFFRIHTRATRAWLPNNTHGLSKPEFRSTCGCEPMHKQSLVHADSKYKHDRFYMHSLCSWPSMDCSTSDVLLRVANMARTRPSWQIWLDVYLLVSSRKKGVPIKGKYDNKVVAKFLQVVKWYRAKFCKR